MAYNPTTNTIDTDTVQNGQTVLQNSSNPAFNAGGYTAAPIQPGQNIGTATNLGNIGNPNGSTPIINTAQPTPQNTNTGAPASNPSSATNTQPYVVKQGDTLSQIAQSNGMSLADLLKANPNISDPNKINSGQQINLANTNQSTASKYQTALSNMKGTPPQTQGDANTQIQGALPSSQTDTSGTDQAKAITAQLQNDPGIQQLMQDQKDYLSSQSQQESLTQQYTDLSSKLGLPALNTQLLNMKSVIDGTEQDIRNEITSAGGFATNSQVMAMASARNKVLTQNYNNLLATRDNAQTQLTTMMGLAEKDQTNATALLDEKMNYDKQIADYTQKFQANAQSALTNMQKTEGWDGIYKAAIASGDPSAIQRINQTMGQGFNLQSMAIADAQTRANALQKEQQTQANVNADNTRANAALAETERHNKVDENKNAPGGVPTPSGTVSMPYNGNYASPTDYVNAVLSKQGVSYATAQSLTPKGTISAIDNTTGQTVTMTANEYSLAANKGKYTVIYNNTK